MIKSSHFNYCCLDGNKQIIYNSLSKAILIADEDIENYIESSHSKISDFLISQNFLVDSNVEEKELYKLFRLDEITKNDLNITILPTSSCNLKCVYCYETMQNTHMDIEIQNRVKLFFNREVRKHQHIYVEWFGGEPLVQKDTIYNLSESIINTCRKYGKTYQASITTNGYLLDISTFQRLLDLHVYTYCITLDGPSLIHDKLKPQKNGEGSFEKIIQNLVDITNTIKSNRFTIVLRINVTKNLLNCFDDFLQFLNGTFGKDPRFTFMFRVVCDPGGDRIAGIRNQLLKNIDVVYNRLLDSKISLDYRAFYALLSNSTCNAVKRHAYTIYTDGTLYKCNNLIGEEKSRVGSLGRYGELLIDKSLLSRWVSTDYNPTQEKCIDCRFLPSCNNCPANLYVLNGNRPCICEEKRIDKILKLLTRNVGKYNSGFIYKLEKGEIVQC